MWVSTQKKTPTCFGGKKKLAEIFHFNLLFHFFTHKFQGFQNAQYLASQKITKKLTFLDSHNVARSKTQKLEQIFMKDGPMLVEYFENLIKRNKQNKH